MDNWHSYNESLVKRGEFYLDVRFVRTWHKELAVMNAKKHGRPYEYPNGLMGFCSVAQAFMQLRYRQMEGFLRKLGKLLGFPAPSYTTPFRRMQRLEFCIPQTKEPVVVAVDATGIKVTPRGEWMHKVWNGTERKGWIKVSVAVDVKTKRLLALEFGDERCHDSTHFERLLDPIPRIADVLGDGAYGNRRCYNYCERRGMKGPPGLKLHKNCITKPQRSWLRQKAALEWKKLGYDGWKEKHGYGRRWAVEGFFSAAKRCFGESVRARSPEGMVREIRRNFVLYSMLM